MQWKVNYKTRTNKQIKHKVLNMSDTNIDMMFSDNDKSNNSSQKNGELTRLETRD